MTPRMMFEGLRLPSAVAFGALLLGYFATPATMNLDETPGGHWGPGGYPEYTQTLRTRLNALCSYDNDAEFLIGWSLLNRDLGIDDNIPFLLIAGHRMPFGNYSIDSDSLTAPTWHIQKTGGFDPPEEIEVPKAPSVVFIRKNSILEAMPDSLEDTLMFVSLGEKAVVVDFPNETVTFVPLARPADDPRHEEVKEIAGAFRLMGGR